MLQLHTWLATVSGMHIGRLVHYLTSEKGKGQPMHSRAHSQPVPGSHRCVLDILHVQQVAVVAEIAAQWGVGAYESYIELHTGRTHQVRHPIYLSRRSAAVCLGTVKEPCLLPCNVMSLA